MTIKFSPTGAASIVRSIEMHNHEVSEAHPGDNVGFWVPKLSAKELKRGVVASDVLKDPARKAIEFTAQIVVLHNVGRLVSHSQVTVHCHTSHAPCQVNRIISKLDRHTGEVIGANADRMEKGDTYVVVLRPVGTSPMAVEVFQQYPSLGHIGFVNKIESSVSVLLSPSRTQPPEQLRWSRHLHITVVVASASPN